MTFDVKISELNGPLAPTYWNAISKLKAALERFSDQPLIVHGSDAEAALEATICMVAQILKVTSLKESAFADFIDVAE